MQVKVKVQASNLMEARGRGEGAAVGAVQVQVKLVAGGRLWKYRHEAGPCSEHRRPHMPVGKRLECILEHRVDQDGVRQCDPRVRRVEGNPFGRALLGWHDGTKVNHGSQNLASSNSDVRQSVVLRVTFAWRS